MSASGMGTGERGEASGMAGVFAGAFWLAKRELRRAWISYPLTGVLLMLMGFFVVPSVSGVFEFDGPGTAGERGWKGSTTPSSPTACSSWCARSSRRLLSPGRARLLGAALPSLAWSS